MSRGISAFSGSAVLYVSIYNVGSICGFRFFNQGRILIGRSPDADLQLVCDNISRNHAVVFVRSDGFIVEDLGSMNGTSINGSRIQRSAFCLQDKVEVGRYTLRFRVIRAQLEGEPSEDDTFLADGVEQEVTQKVELARFSRTNGDSRATVDVVCEKTLDN